MYGRRGCGRSHFARWVPQGHHLQICAKFCTTMWHACTAKWMPPAVGAAAETNAARKRVTGRWWWLIMETHTISGGAPGAGWLGNACCQGLQVRTCWPDKKTVCVAYGRVCPVSKVEVICCALQQSAECKDVLTSPPQLYACCKLHHTSASYYLHTDPCLQRRWAAGMRCVLRVRPVTTTAAWSPWIICGCIRMEQRQWCVSNTGNQHHIRTLMRA